MLKNIENTVSHSDLEYTKVLPLGEILIHEKIISRDQLMESLEIQKKEKSYPLGKILIDKDLISPLDLQKAIDELSKRSKLGDFLLSKKIITEAQLHQAMKEMAKNGKSLGPVLVDLELISKKKLASILIDQSSKPKLGEWLSMKGLISNTNLKIALKFQRQGRRIGHILIDLGYISQQTLNEFISRFNKRESLLATLLREGFVNEEKLNDVNIEAMLSENDLKDKLLSVGIVNETNILQAEAIRHEVPFQRFNTISYSSEEIKALSGMLSPVFIKKNNIIPAFISGNDVTLATSNPRSLEHIDYLKYMHIQMKFTPCFVVSDDFDRIFTLLFGKDVSYIPLKELSLNDGLDLNGNSMQLQQFENMNHSKSVCLLDMIVSKGIELGASDIHIENDAWGTRLRYRVEGILRNLENDDLAKQVSDNVSAVISRLKVISDMDVSERRLPQDGAFRMTIPDKKTGELYPMDFRVSTVKGFGLTENAVIRILDPRNAKTSLEDLDYSGHDLLTIKRMLKSPSGLFLITGPTGSGKSTTLYACIQYLNSPSVKVMTSENPVEYVIKGVTQVNVHNRIGLTHAKVLKSFLRQDPDIIMLGEVRDEEAAEVMVKAAETGHLVFSTMHSSDPILAILRLMDLGISVESLASIVLGVISQRLLKKNCSNCVKEFFPPENDWQQFFSEIPMGMHFYKSMGCEQCGYTGFQGRKPVYEFLVFDSKIQNLLRLGMDMSKIREEALKNGMISMVENALYQPKIFSFEEIFKALPYNLIEEYRNSPIIDKRKTV